MQTVLFNETIFGPIHSRRLGASLGINLSPRDGKVCSFDCLYCEAGYNAQGPGTTGLPPRAEVKALLQAKLADMKAKGERLDAITFSGNGEPTLHPDFAGVIDDTIALRDKYFPDVKISVLNNATMAARTAVADALRRVDNNIIKLDSAVEATMRALDRPASPAYTVEAAIDGIRQFGSECIVQTMLTRGEHDGKPVDNTTDAEIDALIEAYRLIGPRQVMLYSIDRRTPEQSLRQVPKAELQAIAGRISEATGIPVLVS